MGYAPYYQAIPEQSELFRGLQTDNQLAQLLANFFTLGSRPFDLDETGQEELDNVLHSQTFFRSQEDAISALERLRKGIEHANLLSPGLIERSCYIEKTQDEIEKRLVEELRRRVAANPQTRPETWISGERLFAGEFRLVSAPLVSIAASLLQDIEPDLLFDRSGEDYLHDDYRHWRDLYLRAADRGEAILIF